MERRKFVVGLGALASGSAAAMGTGAFTSVEADRTLSVDVEGDADAFLSIKKAKEGGSPTPNAEDYVDIDGDGIVSIDLSGTDSPANGSGVNRNAKTVFDNLLDIVNQGTQEIEVWAESDLIADEGGYLGIYAENSQGDGGDNNGFSESDPATIPVGESETNIGIYIPKNTDFDEVSGGTLTFVAQRTGGNRD